MKFKARYLRAADTSITEELIEAPSIGEVSERLQKQGHTLLSLQSQTEHKAPLSRLIRHKSNPYPLFCREVRTLLRAGMTVVEAIETLAARDRLHTDTSLASQLLGYLQQGMSLSQALRKMPAPPQVLVAAVQAGERTSNLVDSLNDYLRFDELTTQLRKKIVSAAIYPALVCGLGFAISAFLLLVVMPNFATMYENLRGTSSNGALTIEISSFVGKNRTLITALLLLLTGGLFYWIRSGRARSDLMRLGQAIPWIRLRIEDYQLSMMYQALALLLKGGYPMLEALSVAAESALSGSLRDALVRAHAGIKQGAPVAATLAQQGLCDEVGRRLMAAAERNGNFHMAAEVVGQLHGERFELFVERMTRVVEPLLLLAVALVVGGIVIMMYMPVFDMATQLM